MPDDRFNLSRFVAAQNPIIDQVMEELRAGAKRSHWMWFVFPQIAGLGSSSTAIHYAIGSLAEAEAYAAHTLLGPRLRTCTTLVTSHQELSARAIFGPPDDVKFRSSMTLFARAVPGEPVFAEALDTFFDGDQDAATIRKLG